MMKKWVLGLLIYVGVLSSAQSQTINMDPQIERAALCALEVPMSKELAAFRLLISSKAVVQEPRGNLVIYLGALDPKTGFSVVKMTPSRVVVITKTNEPDALVGVIYANNFPLSNQQIIANYQGGLGNKPEFMPVTGNAFKNAGVQESLMSKGPVNGNNHLLFSLLGNGDRLVICAPMNQLSRMVR